MADFSGNIEVLQGFKSQLDSYISKMHQEINAMNAKSRESLGRVRDGAVSGAINDFIDSYEDIEREIMKLEGTSKKLGELILRFRQGKEVWTDYGQGSHSLSKMS